MSNFFVGTLVGFFLGALVVFVGLGIICLYLAKRGEQSPLAEPRTARETRDDPRGAILYPNQEPLIPPGPGPGGAGGLHD